MKPAKSSGYLPRSPWGLVATPQGLPCPSLYGGLPVDLDYSGMSSIGLFSISRRYLGPLCISAHAPQGVSRPRHASQKVVSLTSSRSFPPTASRSIG